MNKPIKQRFIKIAAWGLAVSLISPSWSNAGIESWQKGLTLRLVNQAKSEVDQSLKWMTANQANFVTITPGWLTDSKTSSNVDRKPRTPTDELLIYTIDKAHSLGLKVMLKPHLDIKSGGWRANLNPTDKKSFFENYSKMMLNYAGISKNHNVEQISIGAELYSLTTNPANEAYWRELISKIKTVYNGKLTYSATSNSEFYDEGKLPFWDMLDYVGLSMYYPLANNNSPTVEQLLVEWQKVEKNYIIPLQQKTGKLLIASEIGYRSVDGAAAQPEDYSYDAPVDLKEQADLYKAFFEFWKNKNYFKGVHFWDWEIGQNSGGTADKGYTVQNKPAENILKYYFSNLASASLNNQFTPMVIKKAYILNGGELSIISAGQNIEFYADRNYIIQSLPQNLDGAELVKTNNSDKYISNDIYLTLELAKEATIYIAYDSRAGSIPAWLYDWQKTGDSIGTSDALFNLLKKNFQAGQISLGGNNNPPASGAGSNYFVLATAPVAEKVYQKISPESSLNGKIIVEYPENGSEVTGEKKIKIYIEGLNQNDFTATYNVDGKGEISMANDSSGAYKQAKIQFDNWTWNGRGPYNVIITAKDLVGKIIDQTTLTLFVKQ